MVAAWDVASWLLAFMLFVTLRYDLQLPHQMWIMAFVYTLVAAGFTVIGGFLFHLYLGRSRVGSFDEATSLGLWVVTESLVMAMVFLQVPQFPRGVALVMPPLALMLMASGRWLFRSVLRESIRQRNRHTISESVPRALVYGAGNDGHDVARLVDLSPEPPYRILGFLDDDPGKRYRRFGSLRVLGRGSDLVRIAQDMRVDLVIVAIRTARRDLLDRVAEQCRSIGIRFVTVPPVRERIGGRVRLGDLREFNVADLLGRRPIETNLRAIAGYVAGKAVLVTGAGGSIGSELSRQLHLLGPSKLILLDRDESALHALQLSLYGLGLLDTDDMVLANIRDRRALLEIFRMHQPDVVFHTAALKHLPMLERFPLEGWKTNVLGSLNVLEASQSVGVATLVNVSTDKAADPTSVLGQTKRIAERLTSWYAETHGLRYLSVRFGNVLGSRGSVLYTFRAQIERGVPITVTHPDVTRYFMTIPEACQLVLQAGAIGRPSDVMVLDMGQPIRIVDVARRLLEESHRTDLEIRYTGLRQGEKLNEVLFSSLEQGCSSAHPLISRVAVPALEPGDVRGIDPQNLELVGSMLADQMPRIQEPQAQDEDARADALEAERQAVNSA